MRALRIRNVDERVRDKLAAAAKRRGQPLQQYLHDVLNDEARRVDSVAVIERFSRRRYGTSLSVEDVIETLRAERRARDATLGAPDEERR